MSAGYSSTPLPKKLGFEPGTRAALVGAPDGFDALLGELPEDVVVRDRLRGPLDLVLLFTDERRVLERRLPAVRAALEVDGALWVCWPKRASKVPTDLTEDVVRDVVLPTGLVDVKVAAIDATWSGLKCVLRKALR